MHSISRAVFAFVSLMTMLVAGGVRLAEAGIAVWTSNGPEGEVVRALAIDPLTPTTLYAGADDGGVFKSTDAGGNWSAVNSGLPNADVRALAIDPQSPIIVYAGTYGSGVFKSTDGGGSWSAVNSGLADPYVNALAIDPQTPSTVYAGTNSDVFKSTDGGQHWSGQHGPGLTWALAIDPQTPSTLYAGTGAIGVYKSINGGASWSPVTYGLTNSYVRAMAVDPQSPTIVYAATYGGVFKSTNRGASWLSVNTGLPHGPFYAFAIDPLLPNILYAGAGGYGVYQSADGGGHWSALNSGLTYPIVRALAIDPIRPTIVYAGTEGGGVFTIDFTPPPGGRAAEELVVTNFTNSSVTVYPRAASGDAAPLRTLVGARTGLNKPLGVVQDMVHDELIVANNYGVSVTVHARTANGDTAPLRTVTGFSFGPIQVVLDPIHDELIVLGVSSVNVYSRTASGNAAPLRRLAGNATGLSEASGIALDLLHDELVVANAANNSVTVYARTANGNTPPLRKLQGAATGLSFSTGVALDLVHDELVITNQTNSSITVYTRTATGNAAPLRTLQGPATELNFPIGLVLDLLHDELVVPNFTGSVLVHARQASGNSAPLRTLSGATTGLATPEFATLSASPPLAAAVLPLSRSHQVGTLLTAFATIINAGAGPVQECLVRPPATPPAGLGPFVFQTTDPATNAVIGAPNTPANIPAGGLQTFVFGFTPTAPVAETSLAMTFLCENTAATPRIPGVTDLTLVADPNPVPDTIASIATVSGDGVVRIPGANGAQVFATGTANVGATGTVTVSADTSDPALPVSVTVCETDTTSNCLTLPPTPSLTVEYEAGTTRSFAFFGSANGSIPFDPAVNRVFVRLKDASGTTRGSTSAALCTTPNPGC